MDFSIYIPFKIKDENFSRVGVIKIKINFCCSSFYSNKVKYQNFKR
jgi:hypothetical protein